MNIRKVLCLLTMLACAAENCLAAEGDNLAASIYNHAHFRNREALARLKRNGYSLDATDSRGNTALCTAIMRKDENAYKLLRQMGANTAHPCVKRLEAAVRPVKNDKFVWNVGPTTYLGAAALIGGTVAIAAGGSSGGSKSDGAAGTGFSTKSAACLRTGPKMPSWPRSPCVASDSDSEDIFITIPMGSASSTERLPSGSAVRRFRFLSHPLHISQGKTA